MAQLTPEQFADGVSQALGRRLVSLLLYGSAASGTHVPVRSDVNTLLICDAVDEGLFAALEPALARWVRARNPAPLILAEREWHESADAFAIERSEEHTSELQSQSNLVCRLLLEKKKKTKLTYITDVTK